jgi:serine/threonine protein kinase
MVKFGSEGTYLHDSCQHRFLFIFQNILFSDHGDGAELKIVDFGFACHRPQGEGGLHTACFSLPYAAPEVLNQVPI